MTVKCLLVLSVAATVLIGCGGDSRPEPTTATDVPAPLFGYKVRVGHQLDVRYSTSADRPFRSITVDQGQRQVRVRVMVRPLKPGGAIERQNRSYEQATVTLASPLGSRTVVDFAGRPVTRGKKFPGEGLTVVDPP